MEFKINLSLVFIIYKKAYWSQLASLMVSLQQYLNKAKSLKKKKKTHRRINSGTLVRPETDYIFVLAWQRSCPVHCLIDVSCFYLLQQGILFVFIFRGNECTRVAVNGFQMIVICHVFTCISNKCNTSVMHNFSYSRSRSWEATNCFQFNPCYRVNTVVVNHFSFTISNYK